MGILDYLFGNTYQTPGFNPNTPTMSANVTGMEDTGKTTRGGLPNIFMTPNLAEAGLLGTDSTQALALQDALQSQATRAGLLSAGVSFLTQPRNLRAGSALPYLGRAYQQGMASAGDIYGTGLNQLARQQLLAQRSDEDKLYTIVGALVDRQGNVVYEAPIKAAQGEGPFAKIPMGNVDTKESNLPEFVKRYNVGDPTAYDFLVMKEEKEPILTQGEQIKKELTPLQLKIDEKFAEDLVEFTVGGGFSDVQKNLTQLDLAKETLTNAPKDSITGRLIGIQDDSGTLKYTNPNAQNVKEQVQEIAQRNLRLVLGPQFTAKEGEQLINRVYNPALPQDINIQRLDLLQEQILSAAKSKQEAVDYYNEYGTLARFKGKLYKDSTDFLNDYNSKLKGLETSKETTQSQSRFKEGARTKSKSGKPMVFKNGRWEYE